MGEIAALVGKLDIWKNPCNEKTQRSRTSHGGYFLVLSPQKGLSELGSHLPTLLSLIMESLMPLQVSIRIWIYIVLLFILQAIPGIQERSALYMILRWRVDKFPSKFTETLCCKTQLLN